MGTQRVGRIIFLVGSMVGIAMRSRLVRTVFHDMQLPHARKHRLHEHGDGQQQQHCSDQERAAAEPDSHLADAIPSLLVISTAEVLP